MILTRLGSPAAGWCCDLSLINEESIVYSAGLGCDISWDLELIRVTRCSIDGFDPTPEVLVELRKLELPKRMHIRECGLAAEDQIAKFFKLHPGWITETAFQDLVVVQSPREPVSVKLKCLKTIMFELQHDRIDLLKIDIEGFEYEVIQDLVRSNIRPRQFLVEWHPCKACVSKEQCEEMLAKAGYELIYVEGSNSTYMKAK